MSSTFVQFTTSFAGGSWLALSSSSAPFITNDAPVVPFGHVKVVVVAPPIPQLVPQLSTLSVWLPAPPAKVQAVRVADP
jgi:hypothetical protein